MDRRSVKGECRNEAERDPEDRVPGGDEDGQAAIQPAPEPKDCVNDEGRIEPAEHEPDREPDG